MSIKEIYYINKYMSLEQSEIGVECGRGLHKTINNCIKTTGF